MPRRREPPRLYLRPDEQVWVIRDGPATIRTGCGAGDSRGAEKAFAEYLNEKFVPAVRERSPAKLSVPEVLTAYGREHAPTLHAADRAGHAIMALLPYWEDKTLMEIRGTSCREYAQYRYGRGVKPGTVRRELAVLAAAIRYWHREHGPLDSVPIVTRPERPEGKKDWLTRSEAAQLLAAALGWYKLQWTDLATRKVQSRWRRDTSYHNAKKPHLARFILLSLYTGTRSGAVMSVQWMPNTSGGWVDFEQETLHRRGRNVGQTKKRQPQMRLGSHILAHLRRWHRMDEAIRDQAAIDAGQPVATHMHVISWGGRQMYNIRKAWVETVKLSGLPPRYSPHILRHTRATWLMQKGVDMWEAAGSLGMTVGTLETTYGHHHPNWQKNAAEA